MSHVLFVWWGIVWFRIQQNYDLFLRHILNNESEHLLLLIVEEIYTYIFH